MRASERRGLPEQGPHELAMRALLHQLAHELGALQLMAADMEARSTT